MDRPIRMLVVGAGRGLQHLRSFQNLQNSFAVAGSIIILFLATEMILGIKLYKDNNPKTASVVPIAFPLIAGPVEPIF